MNRATDRKVAAAAAGVALALCLVACTQGADKALPATATSTSIPATPTSTPGSAVPSSTAVSQSVPAPGPKGGPVPVGFVPVSVTFVSLDVGWVLGTAPCASRPCTSLVRTSDRGKTWVGLPAPPVELTTGASQGVRLVRFADAKNGWAFGPELWATHDGGGHWSRVSLPGTTASATVAALEAADGMVHAAVFDRGTTHILSSPASSDAWRDAATTVPLGAGPVPDARILLQGASGWLLVNNRTAVGGARLTAGRWETWEPPCHEAGGPVAVAASGPSDLVAICNEGVWTGRPLAVRSYRSSDGGGTFQQNSASLALGCCVAEVASATPGTIVVGGETEQAPVLLASFDHGGSWAPVLKAASRSSWTDVGFTSTAQGVAVSRASDGSAGQLLITVDGGHSWTAETFR